MKKTFRLACRTALLSSLVLCGHAATADAPANSAVAAAAVGAAAAPAPAPAVFARMGDIVITQEEYDAAFGAAARGKFYHGKAPERDVALLQREVADKMLTRILLVREAQRRGIVPDQAEIKKTLDGYEQRYASSEQWAKNREQILPGLTARLEEDDILAQLERLVRAAPEPQPEEVEAYYKAHPEKFTEPERMRVSVIVKKIDPAATQEEWRKSAEEVRDIYLKIKDGADFVAMAREHSQDPRSAERGGDMGYLHQGMLPPLIQEVLVELKPGDVSEPVQLLEGVGVLKLTDRIPARLVDFERVQERAKGLARRDKADELWEKLVSDLKKAMPAQVDESRFLPLAVEQTDKTDTSTAPK